LIVFNFKMSLIQQESDKTNYELIEQD